MSTRLVILGLLNERPLYGYEIKQIIEGQMGEPLLLARSLLRWISLPRSRM